MYRSLDRKNNRVCCFEIEFNRINETVVTILCYNIRIIQYYIWKKTGNKNGSLSFFELSGTKSRKKEKKRREKTYMSKSSNCPSENVFFRHWLTKSHHRMTFLYLNLSFLFSNLHSIFKFIIPLVNYIHDLSDPCLTKYKTAILADNFFVPNVIYWRCKTIKTKWQWSCT